MRQCFIIIIIIIIISIIIIIVIIIILFYFVGHRNGNSENIRAPDGIRTHDPTWSCRMLYPLSYWRLMVSKVAKFYWQ